MQYNNYVLMSLHARPSEKGASTQPHSQAFPSPVFNCLQFWHTASDQKLEVERTGNEATSTNACLSVLSRHQLSTRCCSLVASSLSVSDLLCKPGACPIVLSNLVIMRALPSLVTKSQITSTITAEFKVESEQHMCIHTFSQELRYLNLLLRACCSHRTVSRHLNHCYLINHNFEHDEVL